MIEKKEFGRTGHNSTRLLFGAAAFYSTTEPDIVKKTMDLIEEAGINHIDTAESYGESQRALGPWLKHNHKKVFLATKTKYRTYKEAKEDLKLSLDLLQVDSIDLWQMHCLAEPEEWEAAKDEENGVIRAFKEAREEGLVRFLGVTSHGMKAPEVLTSALEYYPFDSVLVPYNYPIMEDPKYREDYKRLSELCMQTKTAMQIIKTVCKGPWPETAERNFGTWYEPLSSQKEINTAVGWALNQKHAFINSAADISLLPKIIAAAQMDNPPVDNETMAAVANNTGMSNLFS